MIFLSVVGFAPSIIDQSRRNAPSTPLVAVHGIVAGAWLLFFLAQAILVASSRTAVRRQLGSIGPVLAALLIVVGYLATMQFGRRTYDLSGDVIRALSRTGSPQRDPAGIVFPLADLLNFGILVAAGLWFRNRPEVHKRLMLFALIALADEPILHLVGHLAGHWQLSAVLVSGSAYRSRYFFCRRARSTTGYRGAVASIRCRCGLLFCYSRGRIWLSCLWFSGPPLGGSLRPG